MRLGTKGPKIRFPLGTFVELTDDPGAVYEVVQLYRLRDEPSEWVYRLYRVAYSGRKPTWERHAYLHKMWQEPQSHPPFTGAMTDWSRSVSNKDMLKMATVRMDDLFES